MLAAALLQVALGICDVAAGRAGHLGVAHQAGALLLFTAALLALHANGAARARHGLSVMISVFVQITSVAHDFPGTLNSEGTEDACE